MFAATWDKASNELRHAILKNMFEAVYVDTTTKIVIGVKPYAEFVPLFRQTKMVEQDYCFTLKNEEAAQQNESAERLAVWHGSDGIRIFARREGFRPRSKDLIRVAPIAHRLSEPRNTYHVQGYGTATSALKESYVS